MQSLSYSISFWSYTSSVCFMPLFHSKKIPSLRRSFPKMLLTEHTFLLLPSTFNQNRFRLFRDLLDTAVTPNYCYYYFHLRKVQNQVIVNWLNVQVLSGWNWKLLKDDYQFSLVLIKKEIKNAKCIKFDEKFEDLSKEYGLILNGD